MQRPQRREGVKERGSGCEGVKLWGESAPPQAVMAALEQHV